MEEIKNEVKKQILEAEISGFCNGRYQLEIRHRVQKKLGNEDAMKQIEADMEKLEKSIDELVAIKAELDAVNNS